MTMRATETETATEAEIVTLNRDLVARLAARDARPSQQPAGARKPLGLTPAPGDDDSKPAAAPAFASSLPSALRGSQSRRSPPPRA